MVTSEETRPLDVLDDGKKVLVYIRGLSRNTRRAIPRVISRLDSIRSVSIQERQWLVCTVECDAKAEEEVAVLVATAKQAVREAIHAVTSLRLSTAAHKASAPSRDVVVPRQRQHRAVYA